MRAPGIAVPCVRRIRLPDRALGHPCTPVERTPGKPYPSPLLAHGPFLDPAFKETVVPSVRATTSSAMSLPGPGEEP